MSEPLLLLSRTGAAVASDHSGAGSAVVVLALSAAERQRLRGHFHSRCGRDLLLQLPRGAPLRPGEWLLDAEGIARVRIEAAAEPLLLARSEDPLTLLRAAYHLGNRHVALEVHPAELRLLEDPVLADLLRGLDLQLEHCSAPFQPESGAYGSGSGPGHGQGHGHHHHHGQAHGPSAGQDPGDHHGHGQGGSGGPCSDPSSATGDSPAQASIHPAVDNPSPGDGDRPLTRAIQRP